MAALSRLFRWHRRYPSAATSIFIRGMPSFRLGTTGRYVVAHHRRTCRSEAYSPKWGQWKRWLLLGAVGAGVIAVCVFGKVETVPYSGRMQLLLPIIEDVRAGKVEFEKKKKKCSVLPGWGWLSWRARSITDRILRGMEKGLEEEESTSGSKSGTKQLLEELKWEVVVVLDPDDLAFTARYYDGGKIMVNALLFLLFWEDEIASIIGHEIGHCFARHTLEKNTLKWLMIFSGIIAYVAMPLKITVCLFPFTYFAVWLPFYRRQEREADYIGLLLMAQAGFNPQVAPGVHKRLDTISRDEESEAYSRTHPTGRERAEMLSQEHVMAQAMKLYEKNKPASWSSRIYEFFTGYFNGN